jgi:drug/metabolite transporter (DMT)-like permease|tara:strand:- start:7735 stop:8607 length:873 start_codon:yes stop_codon:yes gene_type:complete
LNNEEKKFTALMILAMITWGYSWTGAKILGPFGDVSSKIFIRFLFASIVLIPILFKYRIPFKINKKGFQFIVWNSISLCSYNYFYFKSTHVGLAGVGGVLVTTLNPILTSIFVFSFLNRSLKTKELSGLLLGLAGGAIIMRLWEMDLELMIQSGNLLYILASLSWVSVTITSQKSKPYIHFLTYSFWSFLIAAFFSILFCDIRAILYTINYDWVYWINILLLSVVVMSFANTMYFFASSKIGAVKASSFIFVVPLTAIIFSVIILKEEVLYTTITGGSLSVVAVYLINRK